MKKSFIIVLALTLIMVVAASAFAQDTEFPRNETLYFAGQQWGAVVGWNPLSSNMNNAMAITEQNMGSRTLMFETLYMFNPIDGKSYPLLADGDPVWNDAQTEVTVKINPAAKWSDGTPVTADDVAYTWECHKKYGTARANDYMNYVDTIEVVDPSTLVIKAVVDPDGIAVNPLIVNVFLIQDYVLQKAWLETLEGRNTADTILDDLGEDVVWSGPYTKYAANDQLVALVRDDNYWGQDASLWGKLPAPKYIVHTIYPDNAAGQVALGAGEVDVCQQFIANIQNMWLEDGLPISTYLEEAPYGLCANMPTAYFNTEVPGLDNAIVRKAIAIAVDYDAINTNAMTGQSPTFTEVPRSLMNPTDGEQAMYDHEKIASEGLQWAGNDIEGANAMLDEAGIVDTDGDGIREIDGKNLSFRALCPNGWSDWQAAMEIVAAAGQNIGIDITTEFPEWSVYQTVFTQAHHDYEIFMYSTESGTPAQPWGRMRALMSSEFLGQDNNWTGNFGHYSNERMDEIIAEIPHTTDQAALIDLYTEAVEIYLTDVPSFSLMYRPALFHAVNESVWTNYPAADDGSEIPVPPTDCTDGYGIACLYNITLVE